MIQNKEIFHFKYVVQLNEIIFKTRTIVFFFFSKHVDQTVRWNNNTTVDTGKQRKNQKKSMNMISCGRTTIGAGL